MAKSVRQFISEQQPQYTMGVIMSKLNGLRSNLDTYIIVEGSDDKDFYEPFFKPDHCFIYWAQKESGDTGGCAYLQKVVSHIGALQRRTRIFGIMDTDYRRFRPGYKYPLHIFNTDHRDLEMTALSALPVQEGLARWCPSLPQAFRTIMPVIRHIGYLRLMNDLHELGCNFDTIIKFTNVFEVSPRGVKYGWKDIIDKLFYSKKRRKKLRNSKRSYRMSSVAKANTYDLCQGHDTIRMVAYILNDKQYNQKQIWDKVKEKYTLEVFKSTQLYQKIRQWEEKHNAQIVKQSTSIQGKE